MTSSKSTIRKPRRLEIHFLKYAILPVRVDGCAGSCPVRALAMGAQVCSRKQRAVILNTMGVFTTSQITPAVILHYFNQHSNTNIAQAGLWGFSASRSPLLNNPS